MVTGYCSDVSEHTSEATINGQTYGINTGVVKMQYVKVGNCEYGVDKSNGLIKFFKHVGEGQTPTVPTVTPRPSYTPTTPVVSAVTKHKVITEVDETAFEKRLDELSLEFNVFATQTHIKEGLWSAVVFYK